MELGNPNGVAALRRAGKGGAALRTTVRVNANFHAMALAPVVFAIRADGHSLLREIASQLDVRGMMTRRGGMWHVSSVRNLLDRLAQLPSATAATCSEGCSESAAARR